MSKKRALPTTTSDEPKTPDEAENSKSEKRQKTTNPEERSVSSFMSASASASASSSVSASASTSKADGGVGVIIHWGIYSVPAFDSVESAQKRKIQNGSEWYAKRLMVLEKEKYPTSGSPETQKHHEKYYKDQPYEDFATKFTAEKWDVDEWMTLFKSINAQYVILTTKHHDGFCLWPTQTTKFNVVDATPFQENILKKFADACRQHGLKFGVYYSWSEFGKTVDRSYLDSVVIPQIDELLTYEPDIWWFDGDWTCKNLVAREVIGECLKKIKQANPQAEINDRIGHEKEREDKNWIGSECTYRVYADRTLPTVIPQVPWEHINTIGYSWGRNTQQKKFHYKTGIQLKNLMTTVHKLKGRFLINVGPDAQGCLDPFEKSSLQELAKLLSSTPPPPAENQIIKEIKGDLFQCPREASMAHCVSQCMTMGAGVALKFKSAFGHVKELLDQKTKIGGIAFLHITDEKINRHIYYLVTKEKFNYKPTFEALEQACTLLRDHAVKNGVTQLCIPQLGCGLDKLDWKQVKPMLIKLFSATPIELSIYSI